VRLAFWRKPVAPTWKQTTFVYCPTCKLEQIANNCFVEDTDLVRYRCVNCGTRTEWLFDAPVPLLISATTADGARLEVA
jgi:transcription elongation factor Elf1